MTTQNHENRQEAPAPNEPKPSRKLKSSAKAAGLKSTLIIRPGELLMTSFGRGNDAVPDKRITGGQVRDAGDHPQLTVSPGGTGKYDIAGMGRTGVTDDPAHRAPVPGRPGDLVHTRAALETRYFGRTFEDSIHIQLIHNILDIEKILSLHINNIIYELNNLLRDVSFDDKDGEQQLNKYTDLLGYLVMFDKPLPYAEFKKKNPDLAKVFERLSWSRQLLYFGLEITHPEKPQQRDGQQKKPEKPDPNTVKLSEEEFYYLLTALSQLRQDLAHGTPSGLIYRTGLGNNAARPAAPGRANDISSASLEDALAALMAKHSKKQDKTPPPPPKAAAPVPPEKKSMEQVVTGLYQERVTELNRDFLNKARVNLTLLSQIYGYENDPARREALILDYYDFVVRKSYKNMGFSIKKLRETMIAECGSAAQLKDQKYDTVRGKLYPFLDFVIFLRYRDDSARVNGLVKALRASQSDEEKEKIYRNEAAYLWPKLEDFVLEHLLKKMNGQDIGQLSRSKTLSIHAPDSLREKMIPVRAFLFTKIIYAMSLFLDGKEINDLLTNLIHKFESIAAFQSVLAGENLPWQVKERYDIFNHSGETASQLRCVNSFARMQKESPNARLVMYQEAAEVLGYRMSETELAQYVTDMLNPAVSGKGSQRRGLRNFIANNVIESSRFRYIARYSNIHTVRALARNPVLTGFVLKDIPDAQILRYTEACEGVQVSPDSLSARDYADMRARLNAIITGMDFSKLTDVRQNDQKANRREQEDKRRKQAAVRLYLTVLYLIVKNLVYINARYFLAFHCVERDRLLLEKEKWSSIPREKKFEPEYSYAAFARDFLNRYVFGREYPEAMSARVRAEKERVAAYLRQNLDNSDDWAVNAFRNLVDHLDAVRCADRYAPEVKELNSWFELYHYVIQRSLIDRYEFESTTESRIFKGQMICAGIRPTTEAYFRRVRRFGTYCKDFVKALNIPFAYNLPRYKNLCIDALFDRNRLRLPEKDALDETKAEEGDGEA